MQRMEEEIRTSRDAASSEIIGRLYDAVVRFSKGTKATGRPDRGDHQALVEEATFDAGGRNTILGDETMPRAFALVCRPSHGRRLRSRPRPPSLYHHTDSYECCHHGLLFLHGQPYLRWLGSDYRRYCETQCAGLQFVPHPELLWSLGELHGFTAVWSGELPRDGG